MWNDDLLTKLLEIARKAGSEILTVYAQDGEIDFTFKEDNSPITEADRRANSVITKQLEGLTKETPILSEESDQIASKTRLSWANYWLVDPLDGTKEFINRNGEFTVNIARVRNGVPDIGIVHVPVTGVTYLGKLGTGAWKVDSDGSTTPIKTSKLGGDDSIVRVVTSRSHRGQFLDKIVEAFSAKFDSVEVSSMGSSLKLCLLAEGKADIYPRLAPTCEWDTGAAHAVLLAAGGDIFDTSFQMLRYNQRLELLNPNFIALGDTDYAWEEMLSSVLP